jgi:hypothetical protein
MLKHIGIVAVVAVMSCLALEVADHTLGLGQLGVVSKAEARVGRPLTPMSVAGVTRRTVRRCAAGVYNC